MASQSSGAGGDFGAVLTAVKNATEAMVARRQEADARAHEAIQAIERSIVLVLGGETMRGLPDLGSRIFGLRIGVEGSAFAKLPVGKPTLIIDAHGMLVVATVFANGNTFTQKAPHTMVRASILVPYVRAVQMALDAHCQSAEQRGREFRRIVELSERISKSVREGRFSQPAGA